MIIVAKILRFLGVKLVVVVFIAAVMTGAAFVINWFSANKMTADQVAKLGREAAELGATLSSQDARLKALEREITEFEKKEPHWWHITDDMLWHEEYERLKEFHNLLAAQRAKTRLFRQETEAEWRRGQQQISPAFSGLTNAYQQTKRQILIVILLALAGPTAWKLFWYFGLAPLADRSRPIRLHRGADPAGPALSTGPNEKACEIPLTPGTRLITRMEWVQQYPPTTSKRTRFLWKWKAPLISFVSGLVEMTEWSTTNMDGTDHVVLASGIDPDRFIMRIDMTAHPGISLRPGCVIAVTDSVDVTTQWRLWSLHSWISGRLRHVIFRGTGAIFISGYGGVRPVAPGDNYRIEEALVLGFERQVAFGTARTETFWPYYRNKTSLFDYRFTGDRHVFTQHALPASLRASGNPFMQAVNAVLNGVGKLIGF